MGNRFIISIVILLVFGGVSLAQKFSVAAEYSYQWSIAGSSHYDGSFEENSRHLIYGSHGKGQEVGVDASYMNAGGWLMGLKFYKLYGDDIEASLFNPTTGESRVFIKEYSEGLKLIPYIGREFELLDKWNFDFGVGAILAFNMKRVFFIDSPYKTIREYSGDSAFGFYSSIAVSHELTDKLDLYLRLNHFSLSWAPAQSEVVTYEKVKGINDLSDYSRAILVTYSDEVPRTSNGDYSKALYRYSPYSSIGLALGLRMSF